MTTNKKVFIKVLSLIVTVITFSCNSKEENKAPVQKSVIEKVEVNKQGSFKLWTWVTAQKNKPDNYYKEEFKKYRENNIDAILLNTNGDPELLKRLVPIAKKNNLEVHAWMFTMNRPGDKVAEQHPNWYAVSRDGKSCYDNPPYVGYYKWLCPTRKESREHILGLIEKLVKVDGISSFHLDYIRYSDIFLPVGLLPIYDLEQNTELPRYDFCYCDVCLSEFEEEHHKNPKDFSNPAIDMEWKNFRLNKVKAIVDDAYKIAHANNKLLTAAVFPYPEMADNMVRQRWDKWNIDAVLPMIYHTFYNEEIDWIGYATKQGIADLKKKNTELHTGLYMPDLTASDLQEAIRQAKTNGANGVSFFHGSGITDEQWKVIKQAKNN